MALIPTYQLSKRVVVSSSYCLSSFKKNGNGETENNVLGKKHQPLFFPPSAPFHYHTISQIYFQAKSGILLDILRKSKAVSDYGGDINRLQIPDELLRLKSGSLNWIFNVWLHPKMSFSALSKVQSLLQVENVTRRDILKSPKLRTANEEQLHQAVEYLKSRNIAIRRLVKLPWLLNSDPVALEESVKLVQRILQLNNFKVSISFVNTNELKLREAAFIWKKDIKLLAEESKVHNTTFKNRIDFIAYHLKCPPEDVSDMMSKVTKLLSLPLINIKSTLETLLEGGVRPDGIINDPWVFVHNMNAMKARLQILHSYKIFDFKPWVLRTPQRIFDSYVTKTTTEKELLGPHNNASGFLQEKLDISQQDVANIFLKVPAIKRSSATKLNEMIDYLFSEGFTPADILSSPRVLAHNVDTVSERLKEVGFYKQPVESLLVLCRTQKDYRALIRKWKKEKGGDSNK